MKGDKVLILAWLVRRLALSHDTRVARVAVRCCLFRERRTELAFVTRSCQHHAHYYAANLFTSRSRAARPGSRRRSPKSRPAITAFLVSASC